MKKGPFAVVLDLIVVGAGTAVVRSRRPTRPEVRDRMGLFPPIPSEKR
jgi:hypothetical protein